MHDLIRDLVKFSDERDWRKFHSPKELAISVSIEAAELLELFQWTKDTHDISAIDAEKISSEASDVFIYLILLFERLGLDPEVEVRNKMKINEGRFPVSQIFGKPGSKL